MQLSVSLHSTDTWPGCCRWRPNGQYCQQPAAQTIPPFHHPHYALLRLSLPAAKRSFVISSKDDVVVHQHEREREREAQREDMISTHHSLATISYSVWAWLLASLLCGCQLTSFCHVLCYLTAIKMRRGLLSDDDSSTYASMDSSSSSSSTSTFYGRLSPVARNVLLAVGLLLLLLLGVIIGWVAHSSFPAKDEPQNPSQHILSPLVVYISINGFRASYLDWYMPYLPAFRRLTSHGLRAMEMNPVMPTVTYPNHYTLATGLWPESHGIVSNSMYDPSFTFNNTFGLGEWSETDGRWYEMAEPVWLTAKRHGLKTAVHFWAGSDAEINGMRPDSYTHFQGEDDDDEFPDNQRLVDLLHEIETGVCQLCMMHLDNIDHLGHRTGPNSTGTLSALITYDNWLQRLLDGLEALGVLNRTHLVLVSDHGMVQDYPQLSLSFANYTNVTFTASDQGAFSALWPANASDTQRLYDDLAGLPNAQVFLRESDTALSYHYSNNRRIAPVLVQSDESWQIYTRFHPAGSGGSHGYDHSAHSHTPPPIQSCIHPSIA